MKQTLKEYVAIEDYLDEDGKTVLIAKGAKLRQACSSCSDGELVFVADNYSKTLTEQTIKESGAFRPIQLLLG